MEVIMRGNMKAERARLGLSAEEAAEKIGVHPNSLRRWESGEAEPVIENLERMAGFYGCSVEYLLEQTDKRDGRAIAKG